MNTKDFFLSLLFATMMCVPFTANAQVTIGSTDLPQAMLDIRAYPEMPERGQGFRLIDGNEFPGRVLTAGEDGFGTWENPPAGTRTLFHNPPGTTSHFLTVQPSLNQTAVIMTGDDYSFILEPGFWRIDFNIPIVVLNPEVFTALNSFVELMIVVTYVPYVENNGMPPFLNTSFTTITFPTATRHRAMGSIMIDTRGRPTQRYYLAVGRAVVHHISDNVSLEIKPNRLTRTGFATFTPEI